MLLHYRSSIIFAAVVGVLGLDVSSRAQPAVVIHPLTQSSFELSDSVQLEHVDQTVLAQLERVKACLADRQWQEAVDTLCRLAELPEPKLIGVTERRYVDLRDYCQMQFANLPSEALTLYRQRVDAAAQKWYETGIAQREPNLLWNVVDQAFASSVGDKALLALGEMACEANDMATARWCWERIMPKRLPLGNAPTWLSYPDTKLDLAAIRARLVLVSILEGSNDRARNELAQFARLHPNARGRLAGREVNYTEALEALLTESAAWPPLPTDHDWPTFAGNPQRNKVASSLVDVGAVAWRVALPPTAVQFDHAWESDIAHNTSHAMPRCEPLVVGNMVMVNDPHTIQAYRFQDGRPQWGNTATIYQSQLSDAATNVALPTETLGAPHFTMTAFAGRLFARMGSTITSASQGARAIAPSGNVVCLDLNAQGRLLWSAPPDDGWTFEGAPVVAAHGVYLAMRRSDIRPQAAVACLDPETGRLRWRCAICSAETPGRGLLYESTHNLLTLVGNTLYCNTNLGAVAAVRAGDGRLLWVSLYPRARRGDLAQLAPHWQRALNPCVFDRGTLLVAPADSPRIFALDAATGQILWQTGAEAADVLYLLGTTHEWLIAGGRRLYWIGLADANRGRVKHVWPDSAEGPGCGRGLLAGDSVLWPTHEKLYVFDQSTAAPKKVIDLAARGTAGGNLLVADGRLLIATTDELVVLDTRGGSAGEKNPLTENTRKCLKLTMSKPCSN